MSDSIRKQRDILFEACKQVATNKRCPDWISGILRNAVLACKQAEVEDFPELGTPQVVDTAIHVGDYVLSSLYGNECKYRVIKEAETVEGIRLFHIQFVEGKNNGRPVSYNVPETMLKKVGV